MLSVTFKSVSRLLSRSCKQKTEPSAQDEPELCEVVLNRLSAVWEEIRKNAHALRGHATSLIKLYTSGALSNTVCLVESVMGTFCACKSCEQPSKKAVTKPVTVSLEHVGAAQSWV